MGKFEKNARRRKNPLVIPVVILSVLVVLLASLVVYLLIRQGPGQNPGENSQMQEQTDPRPEQTLPQTSGGATTEPADTQPQTEPAFEETQPRPKPVEVYVDGDLCVPTPYVVLHLPEQWAQSIRVEQSGPEGAEIFTFYGRVEGKPEVGLFIVQFNGDGTVPLGTLTTEDAVVYINATPLDPGFDDSWDGERIDLICAMQESLNYIRDELMKDPAFQIG